MNQTRQAQLAETSPLFIFYRFPGFYFPFEIRDKIDKIDKIDP